MVDIPGNSTTTQTIAVGGTVNDTLEVIGDRDWFRIELTAGQSISVFLDGLTLEDSHLRIRDASGNVLYENDDISSGINRDSLIGFTASTTGTYFIDVGAFEEGYAGTYQLSVRDYVPPPVATVDQFADQLVSGYWGGEQHRFNVSPGGSLTINLSALTASGQRLARAALQSWTDVIGVDFVEVATGAQITFDDSEEGAHASSTYSGGFISSSEVNVSTQWLTDYGTSLNGYAFQAYVHEVGHALGLGHAGDYNIEARYPFDARFKNDSWAMSVMSYFDQRENTFFADQGFTKLFVGTPMVADIAAMSRLYGLSTSTRLGDTVYGFGSTANSAVLDATIHPDIAYTVFDSGGIDTLNYSGFTQDQRIDLNPEAFSNVGGRVGNVSIGRGVVIENATGGGGNDVLIGNGANNVLNGGAGNDTVSYERATEAVTVNLVIAGAQNTVGAGNDTLVGIENLIGSQFGDRLTGGAGNTVVHGGGGNDILVATPDGDRLLGEAGDDTFIGAAGSDSFEGGDGFDTVDYSASTGAVRAGSGATGGVNGSDQLSSVERIVGSNFDDQLSGGSVILGGAGNDIISHFLVSGQGGAGNDIYDPGDGATVVEAAGEGTDLIRSLRDYILPNNVENLSLMHLTDPHAGAAVAGPNPVNGTGNALDNVITGNMYANRISGLAGVDTLSGGADRDTLTGGAGNDIFRDTAADLNGDTITDFAVGDRIVISNASLNGFSFSLSNSTLNYTGGSLTLAGVSGHLQAAAAAGGGVQLSLLPPSPRAPARAGDFNGDGRDDILWRAANGTVTDWLGTANGGFIGNFGNANLALTNDWQVAGIGDFNGDGRDDILWRALNGTVTDWLGTANGGFVGNFGNANLALTNDWQVAGTGDFNGDGRDDILWRAFNGTVTDWLGTANGGFAGNFNNANLALSNDWQIAGTGDFNGDGRDDILWRAANGAVTDWLGTASGGFIGNFGNANLSLTNDWRIEGTGDFNGDGRDDILWRNANGTVTDWLGQANGGFAGNFGNANLSLTNDWRIEGTGDFNGDGRDDILWRNANGTVTDWLGQANGGFAGNFGNANLSLTNDWQIQPADYLI